MRAASLVLWSAMVLLATPPIGAAQESGKTPRVAYVRSGSFAKDPYREAFLRGMRERGWIAGRNIAFEFRYYGDDVTAITSVVEDLLRVKTRVILTGGAAATRAAQRATRSVPIVMTANDPVGSGLIASFVRPGGNTTGLSIMSHELTVKRLELVKELLPPATRIAILQNADNPSHRGIMQEIQPAAQALGLSLRNFTVRSSEDISQAFAAMQAWRPDAVIILDDSAFIAARGELAAQALRNHWPLVCGFKEFAQAGCLLSYAVDLSDAWYRVAAYVDKVLKGAQPRDLPVQQAGKFELVINLKTAKALGLTIPQSLLQRADQVIE